MLLTHSFNTRYLLKDFSFFFFLGHYPKVSRKFCLRVSSHAILSMVTSNNKRKLFANNQNLGRDRLKRLLIQLEAQPQL